MSTPEVRLSPDGVLAAIKTEHGWKVNFTFVGALFTDEQVSEWTPLLPVSNEDGAS